MTTIAATPGTLPPAHAPAADKPGHWPYGPHAAAMLSFNQLPSRWLHASRWPSLLPPGWAVPGPDDDDAHRHCSALLLRQLGTGALPVTDWQRPEWPLAVLPPPAWARLLQRLGLVLVQPLLRQLIGGEPLRALAARLGADDLHWVRQGAPRLPSALQPLADLQLPQPAAQPLTHPGTHPVTHPVTQLADRLPQWAAGVLAQATAAAPAPMRHRLALRAPVPLPQRPDVAATRAAWALTLTLIDELEPAWRSSFPGSR